MMSRKFINHVLRACLFSLFIPSVSFADFPGGNWGKYTYLTAGTPAFSWELRNGNVYILTNSIKMNLFPDSPRPGQPCAVTGCLVYFMSNKYSNVIKFDGSASLATVQAVLGQTGPLLNPRHAGARSLCIAFSDQKDAIQFFPASCGTGGADAGLPPINPPDPPVPPLSCSINSGAIRHGEVSLAALSGHRAATNLQIICNRLASVKITSSGYSKSGLALQGQVNKGTLNTRIKIQGIPLENGVTMTVNNIANVNVSSELLSSDNVTPSGFYSGSVILVATFN